MLKTDNVLISNALICKDKMKLTVTNIPPVFQEKSEQEVRQEISAKLYQVFVKYGESK